MRTHGLIVLTAGLMIAACAPKEDAVKKDYERLTGTWILVSAVKDGKEVPEEEVKNTRLITKGDKFTISGDPGLGTSGAGTFTIDPSKNPKTVDSVQSEGPDAGTTVLGIYEIIDDNAKRACWAPPGQARPSGFNSKPGSGHLLQVWKRVRE